MTPNPSKWISTAQAATELGVTSRTLRTFINTGDLTAYRFGRVIRVREDDVAAFIEASRITPGSLGTV